jgi:membrane associated rhomboid family serine protease
MTLDAPTRLTIATSLVLGVTIVATGLQMIYAEVLSALRRDPHALAAGEWWRLFTPLFVHSDGWAQIITNLMALRWSARWSSGCLAAGAG